MNNATENIDLQQLISNAVHSALTQGGIKSNTEAVSTASSLKAEAMSRRACENRMRQVGRKMYRARIK